MLIDLHAKSNYSPSVNLSPRQVLQQASDAGLDGIAFCETLSSSRCKEILDLAARDFPDLKVFIGVEIPTDRGIFLGFVPEINSFYTAEEWRWLTHKTTPSADAVIELFEEHNGFVIAARPYDLEIPFNMGDFIFTFDRLGAVEVFNPRVGQLQNNFALEAATFMGLNTVGGSDPKDDPSVIGQYATFFEEDIQTQRQFVEELRESEYWAVQIGSPGTQKSSRKASKSRRSQGGRGSRGGRRSSSRRSNGRRNSGGRRGSRSNKRS